MLYNKYLYIIAAVLILMIPNSIAFAEESYYDLKVKAQKGDVEAQTKLGYLLLNENQHDMAKKWFTAAVEAEYPSLDAMVGLGQCYEYDWSINKSRKEDYQKAIELYTRAADKGLINAYYYLGSLTHNNKDYQSAKYWYEKAVEGGSDVAANNLGILYWLGLGCDKDRDKAISMLETATVLGFNPSNRILGNCLQDMGKEDLSKMWYLRAAGLGDGDAMVKLGDHYYFEYKKTGNRETAAEALSWYVKATESSSKEASTSALYNIRAALEDGCGPGNNLKSSIKEYQRLAEGGDRDALKMLHLCLTSGINSSKIEIDKSINYLIKYGTQYNNDEAYYLLGKIYRVFRTMFLKTEFKNT